MRCPRSAFQHGAGKAGEEPAFIWPYIGSVVDAEVKAMIPSKGPSKQVGHHSARPSAVLKLCF